MYALLVAACKGDDPTSAGPDAPAPDPTPTAPSALCLPRLAPRSRAYVEGDFVEVDLTCASGLPVTDFVPNLVEGPDGAHLEGSLVVWHPDLASAGPHDLTVSIGVPGGMPDTGSARVWVADAGPGVERNFPPDFTVYTEEFGLPVVACWPGVAVGSEWTRGFCAVDGHAYAQSYVRLADDPSGLLPKPSYTLDFTQEELQGEALDLHDKGHLALLSTFGDPTAVRHKLFLDLWRDLEEAAGADRPTADTEFVVLYLDDQYAGLYVATDPIDDEFFDEHALSPDGDVFRAVSADANFRRTMADGSPKADLTAGWVQVEGADPAALVGLTTFAADADPLTFAADAGDWIHTDELVDWALLTTFAAAAGNAAGNGYLYEDPLSPGFRYVPWAPATAFGPEDAAVVDDYRAESGLFEQLYGSSLAGDVAARQDAVTAEGGPLHPASIGARLDAYHEAIEPAARRDWDRWEPEHEAWTGATADPDEERARLRTWIDARAAALP